MAIVLGAMWGYGGCCCYWGYGDSTRRHLLSLSFTQIHTFFKTGCWDERLLWLSASTSGAGGQQRAPGFYSAALAKTLTPPPPSPSVLLFCCSDFYSAGQAKSITSPPTVTSGRGSQCFTVAHKLHSYAPSSKATIYSSSPTLNLCLQNHFGLSDCNLVNWHQLPPLPKQQLSKILEAGRSDT